MAHADWQGAIDIKTLAMILAGGAGTRLMSLTDQRAKPAVPFAGKFRIIDFTLSNCVHSGISTVGVLTQYQPHSLQDHLGIGKPWDLDRAQGGIRVLQPYTAPDAQAWYTGTADAILRNLFFIEDHDPDAVLILSGDHIYKMDYTPMLDQHRRTEADLTVAVMPVPLEETPRFGIMETDDANRVLEFHEKPPGMDKGNLASMGIYIFSTNRLVQRLREGTEEDPRDDFGQHVIPAMIERNDRVFAFNFDGYWVDVGTLDSYWSTNLDLLKPDPPLDMYTREWPVLTRSTEHPPAKVSAQAQISRSLVCNGSVIKGKVHDSVLSPGVQVSVGAEVVCSVLMSDTWIGPGVRVENAILDKSVVVAAGARIGVSGDCDANQIHPDRLHTGLTVVGKGAFIPDHSVIGGNVHIAADADASHFPPDGVVADGSTIG